MASIDLFTTCNLLRYISEWDPREPAHTKGGYMDGEIKIPNVKGKLRMEIQTFPAEDVDPLVANVHPCLLHVVRIGKGKRDQELEPVPTYYHWKQIFEIENGKVKILNRVSQELDVEKDGFTPRPVPLIDEITEVHGNSIVLGRKRGQLNLILLQPKQQARAKPTEATVTKVLADRLQTDNNEKLELHEQFFKKKHAKNLKRIRLKVDFYNENGENCGSSVSPQTIIDTGNKEIGSMDFYDATPHKSCVKGGRKIIMVSEYNLAKDVSPVFQVYDEFDVHRPELDEFLVQPNKTEFNLKNQTIIFITPEQPRLLEIRNNMSNYNIKLLAKRKGDGYTSNKMFNFRYIEHEVNQCPFCDYKVDSDELVQIEVGIERPKPGQKKRGMYTTPVSCNEKRQRVFSTDEQSTGSSAMSPGFSASPTYSNSNSYEMQVSSPDSGIFNGFKASPPYSNSSSYEIQVNSPDSGIGGSNTPNSEFNYTMTQEQLNKMDVGSFEDEDVVSKILGIPSTNVESLWGHQEITETYEDVIKTIDFDQLLNMDIPEEDSTPQTAQISNIGSSFNMSTTHFTAANAMMSNRDPMISHGSIINTDANLTVRKQGPVLLQHRIKSDSTKKPGMYTELKIV